MKGSKRIDKIQILDFYKTKQIDIKQYKIFIIASKLKLNILYVNHPSKLYFEGIIFHKENYLIAMLYYFVKSYKKKNKYVFTDLEVDIVVQYLNNNTRKNIEYYINKYIITKKIPSKLKHIFENSKDISYMKNVSYKQNYIDYLNVIKKNKRVMKEYYDTVINNAIQKLDKYMDSNEFNNFMKRNKHRIKTFDFTLNTFFKYIKHTKEIKQKISNELNKIK
jgi:hypothetical protein